MTIRIMDVRGFLEEMPMKSRSGALLLCLAALASFGAAQTSSPATAATPALTPVVLPPEPAPPDAASVDAIVRAIYECVSYAPGQEPDWNRLRALFLPGARMIPPHRPSDPLVPIWDVEAYRAMSRRSIAMRKAQGREAGFSEREVARRTNCFGNICQVFSTYESRFKATDEKPFSRGINGIDLISDGGRWWIATIFWDAETSDKTIPKEFLPAPK
jgi:hypothetical protein